MDSIVVVGLGNPGAEYEGTRHNLGFDIVDELAGRLRAQWKTGDGEYLTAVCREVHRTFILAKPLTYMNNSGSAVAEVLKANDASLENLIVVVDDLALPLGELRMRAGGSDGGHNGLRSVIFQLNSNAFARLRCGIKREDMPPKESIAQFVLSTFDREERKAVKAIIVRAADAVTEFASSGVARTMNRFNTR